MKTFGHFLIFLGIIALVLGVLAFLTVLGIPIAFALFGSAIGLIGFGCIIVCLADIRDTLRGAATASLTPVPGGLTGPNKPSNWVPPSSWNEPAKSAEEEAWRAEKAQFEAEKARAK
jgi:hypothetical protein